MTDGPLDVPRGIRSDYCLNVLPTVSFIHIPKDGDFVVCTSCSTSSVVCAGCGAPICADHATPGHPLITARQLITTIATTTVRAPALLGDLLFKELDQVTYCVECRETVAVRRQSEQMKLAGVMLVVLLLVIAIPTYLVLT